MPRYIAFLRAINVGGRTARMEELRAIFESLGLSKVETFLASGNVVFESRSRGGRALRKKIEDALYEALGYEVSAFLRTDSEVAEIARTAPFEPSKVRSAKALNVAFLAEPLKPDAEKALMRLRTDVDDLHAHGREVYWLCKKKQSESKFSNAVLEKTLNARATLRGFNTVVRLAAKYPP